MTMTLPRFVFRLKEKVEQDRHLPPDHLQAAIPDPFRRSDGKAGRFARPTPHPRMNGIAHGASLARRVERGKPGFFGPRKAETDPDQDS
jgi:hypothetical protein